MHEHSLPDLRPCSRRRSQSIVHLKPRGPPFHWPAVPSDGLTTTNKVLTFLRASLTSASPVLIASFTARSKLLQMCHSRSGSKRHAQVQLQDSLFVLKLQFLLLLAMRCCATVRCEPATKQDTPFMVATSLLSDSPDASFLIHTRDACYSRG